jgi:predicted enzyme related to lactoylglutathione lyase
MQPANNAINWFEIPAIDIERARGFYQAIFGIEMFTQNVMGMDMAFFPATPGNGKVSGALCKSEMHKPSHDGCILYLNGDPDLQAVLDKVEPAGGQVVMPKTNIGDDIGHMAFFIDTEGNKMALHSNA